MASSASSFIPDVLDEFSQTSTLEVTFGDHLVKDGEELTPTIVKDEPKVSWEAMDHNLYTIALVDPDAPSVEDRKFACWVHWFVVNVPGGSKSPKDGDTIVEFVSSAPGEGSGAHRYTVLVFEQEKRIDPSSAGEHIPVASGFPPRRSFDVRKKMADLSLKPIAGVHYRAAYDDLVPSLHAKIKGE